MQEESVIQNIGHWAFVLKPVFFEAELPFEIASGCFISKASAEQITQIKTNIVKFIGSMKGEMGQKISYESEQTFIDPNNIYGGREFEALPESQWRYYVVAFPDNKLTHRDLHLASSLSDFPLEIDALHFYKNGAVGCISSVLQNHFELSAIHIPEKVSLESLQDLSRIYSLYMQITNGVEGVSAYPEILRAIQMSDSLRRLPTSSEFHVLGLFAIIEMLITHNPKLEDRGDSITHQMKSKMPLLSRRFDRELDFASFFPGISEKTIWSALYGYRSAVAHGGLADFEDKKFKILKSSKNVDNFLRQVVKSLLRHSLKEPELYRDLRDC